MVRCGTMRQWTASATRTTGSALIAGRVQRVTVRGDCECSVPRAALSQPSTSQTAVLLIASRCCQIQSLILRLQGGRPCCPLCRFFCDRVTWVAIPSYECVVQSLRHRRPAARPSCWQQIRKITRARSRCDDQSYPDCCSGDHALSPDLRNLSFQRVR